jgi:hypothetical protein
MIATQRDFVRFIWPYCENDRQRVSCIVSALDDRLIPCDGTSAFPDYADWLLRDALAKGWHLQPISRPMSYEDMQHALTIMVRHDVFDEELRRADNRRWMESAGHPR